MRRYEPEEQALAAEGMLTAAFPGHAISWDGGLRIEIDPGSWRHVEFPGFSLATDGSGSVVFGAVELQEDRQAVLLALESFEPVPDAMATSTLVFLRMGAEGVVSEQRERSLALDERVTEVRSVTREAAPNAAWPILVVMYRSSYVSRTCVTTIDWLARVESDSMQYLWRLPVAFSRRCREGSATSGDVTTDAVVSGESTLHVLDRSVTFRCSETCVVPSDRVLEAIP